MHHQAFNPSAANHGAYSVDLQRQHHQGAANSYFTSSWWKCGSHHLESSHWTDCARICHCNLWVCVPACVDSHNVRPQLPHHHGYSSEKVGIVDGIAAVGDGGAAVGGVVASFGNSGGRGGEGDGCSGGCGG